jgi:hypothetical protein
VEQLPEEVLAGYEPQHAAEVQAMAADPQVFAKLVSSVCPAVWGHEAVKQAVLLMLLGGVHKRTKEGANLRGDINVAIVGDPACAKSQILKCVLGVLEQRSPIIEWHRLRVWLVCLVFHGTPCPIEQSFDQYQEASAASHLLKLYFALLD